MTEHEQISLCFPTERKWCGFAENELNHLGPLCVEHSSDMYIKEKDDLNVRQNEKQSSTEVLVMI